MNRQQKEMVVAQLCDKVAHSVATFVVGYRGLTVPQLHILRTDLRKVGGELKVAKARLIKKAIYALDQDSFDGYTDHLHDQIGIVFASTEVSAVAKALYDFSKNHTGLTIVAGSLDKNILNNAAVVRIASLPNREQLLAQLCATLQAPIASLARVLNMVVSKPALVLKEIEE